LNEEEPLKLFHKRPFLQPFLQVVDNHTLYQDVDKQFGQIVKLFPYAQNLLCVFEHGLAVVPINEKALLSTQEGLSIHLYGAGVLQEQVSVISPDYGST
jgi:hypothetical protein